MSAYKQIPAKEKAVELIEKFTFMCRECDWLENATQNAIVCVNEIIENCDPFDADYWHEVLDHLID